MLFTFFIVAGYAYVWRKGGLDLATRHPLMDRRRNLP